MTVLNTWQVAPVRPDLANDSLHIWRIALDGPFDEPVGLLSKEELARAGRFTAETPKHHFVIMRTALRNILSNYTDAAPNAIEIKLNEHGKPMLRNNSLTFNLSHSGDTGLIAVSKCGDVGVDIEKVSLERATHDVAVRFFSPAENEALNTLNGDEKTRAFFRCWSRKEAVIKALGEGLSCGLTTFDISIDKDTARLVEFRRNDVNPLNWSIVSIDAGPDSEAAAAMIGTCGKVFGFDYSCSH